MNKLVGWLIERQAEEDLSDNRFARERLMISQALWSMLRRGKRKPSLYVVRQAIAAYPEHERTILRLTLANTNGNGAAA